MIFKNFFFLITILYTSGTLANNIRVVNLELLINQNKDLITLISKIESDQTIHKEKFLDSEKKLKTELERIDGLKLILDNNELEKEINKYNQNLNDLNLQVEKFNSHYETQINSLKNIIFQKILEILKKYSTENQIDLILDANSYILSSNSINITNLILDELNNYNFEINFEQFK